MATFSLCLLAQAYEQAYNLLQILSVAPVAPIRLPASTNIRTSAELEMTVNILIQIDKLVQLLESPVFTCMYKLATWSQVYGALTSCRSPVAIARAGQAPAPLQVPLRTVDAPASVIGLCCSQEPAQQRELDRISAYCTAIVRIFSGHPCGRTRRCPIVEAGQPQPAMKILGKVTNLTLIGMPRHPAPPILTDPTD